MKTITRDEMARLEKEIEKKHIRPDERSELLKFSGSVNAQLDLDLLEARIRTIPDGWRDLQLIRSMGVRLRQKIYRTIPDDEMPAIDKTCRGMMTRVVFARPMNSDAENREIGRWVSTADQYTAIELAKEHCTFCTKEKRERKQCKVREMLEHMPLTGSVETDDRDCAYWRVWSMETRVL